MKKCMGVLLIFWDPICVIDFWEILSASLKLIIYSDVVT